MNKEKNQERNKILNLLKNERLNRFLEKFGGYSAVLSVIIIAIMLIVGTTLYSITEPMNMFTHWISNIGAGYNGSSQIFSVLLITTIIVEIPFIFDLIRRLFIKNNEKERLSLIIFSILIIVIIGILGISFFNLKAFPILHVISAISFFIGSMLMMLSFSIAIIQNPKFPIYQALVGFVASFIFLVFLSTFMPYLIEGRNLVNIIISMSSEYNINRFWEWLSVFGLMFWTFETGIYFLKHK